MALEYQIEKTIAMNHVLIRSSIHPTTVRGTLQHNHLKSYIMLTILLVAAGCLCFALFYKTITFFEKI